MHDPMNHPVDRRGRLLALRPVHRHLELPEELLDLRAPAGPTLQLTDFVPEHVQGEAAGARRGRR